jgi:hyperosmotically inducible protein
MHMPSSLTPYAVCRSGGRYLFVTFVASVLAVGILSGCDNKQSNETVGQQVGKAVDATVSGTKEAVQRISQDAATTADTVKRSVQENAPGVEAGAREAGSALKSTFENATLTAKVTTRLHQEGVLTSSTIDVTSSAGVVTLKGSVPTADAKAKAGEVAQSVEGVSSVDNQLAIAGA